MNEEDKEMESNWKSAESLDSPSSEREGALPENHIERNGEHQRSTQKRSDTIKTEPCEHNKRTLLLEAFSVLANRY